MEDLRLVRKEAGDPPVEKRLQDAIDSFNVEVTGRSDWWPVTIVVEESAGRTRGGLVGGIWAGWLHVTVLWLEPELRRLGLGSRLLRAAEEYAVERGCRHAHLETFSFQAPEFYRRLGYEVFGRLEDYPQGHVHYYLKKDLKEAG